MTKIKTARTAEGEKFYYLGHTQAVVDDNGNNIEDLLAEQEEKIELLNDNTGISEYPEFSTSKTYKTGTIVKHEGALFKFTSDHAPGIWDLGEVKSWSINAESQEKLTELGSKLIELKGFSVGADALGLKVGEYYFNTDTNEIRYRHAENSSILVPYVKGAVYLCHGTLYRWDFDNQKLRPISNGLLNVNTLQESFRGNHYTLEEAISAVPINNRRPLQLISYRTAESRYEYAQYLVSDTSDTYWLDLTRWKVVLNTTQTSIYNINTATGIYDKFYTLDEAINAIPNTHKEPFMLIMFRSDTTKHSVAMFNYSTDEDEWFYNSENWKIIITSTSLEELEEKIYKEAKIINVNDLIGDPARLFESVEEAAQLVPQKYRGSAKIITFRVVDANDENLRAWASYQYIYTDISDKYWNVATSWVNVMRTDIDLSVLNKKVSTINVHKYVNQYGNGYTLTEAISLIEKKDRFGGVIITFRDKDNLQRWRGYQFIVGDTVDANWYNINNWSPMNNVILGFPIKGGINRETGRHNEQEGYKCTQYLEVKKGIIIRASQGAYMCACAFYDRDFNYISAITFDTTGEHLITLSEDNIPSEAVYFRATSSFGSTAMVYSPYTEPKGIDPLTVELWKNSDRIDYTPNLILSSMYKVGDLAVGETILLEENSVVECIKIPCKKGETFKIWGSGGNNPRLWCFTDTNMALIKSSESGLTANGLELTAESDGYFIFNNVFTYYKNPKILKISTISKRKTKWMALGDSITQGYYSDNIEPYYHLDPTKSYCKYIEELNGWELNNKAIGGTGYICKGPKGTSTNGKELVDTLDFSNTDLVTIAYGVNDWKYNEPLGSMEDDISVDSIIPAMRYVIEKIISSNPLTKIVVITPINCAVGGNESTNYGLGYKFSNNGTLEDIFNAMVEVCEYYGIEYVDMTHSSIFNRKNLLSLLLDKVHPTIPSLEVMGKELAAKISFR